VTEAAAEAESQTFRTDTLPPEAISDELAPTVAELGLEDNCRELAELGYTVVENVSSPEFNQRLREAIIRTAPSDDPTQARGSNMAMRLDPVIAEAVINPSLMAMAEFTVGRGHLISQVATSVTPGGTGGIGLHADQNWLPAPFPEHNMITTMCWATDEFTEANGSTHVVPRSHLLRRHPTEEEMETREGIVAIECPAGSVAIWDGSIWHTGWPRTTAGERVVCHISYSRLSMRIIENYAADADGLIAQHGEKMAQLLGRNDSLDSPTGFEFSKVYETFNNSKI
jgi:hypothetical protein